MLLRRRIRQVHRLLGLVVFIQLLFWVGGGLTMAFLDLDEVRGAHRKAEPVTVDLRMAESLFPVTSVLANVEYPVRSVQLDLVAGNPVYRVTLADGLRLFDAAVVAYRYWRRSGDPDLRVASVRRGGRSAQPSVAHL